MDFVIKIEEKGSFVENFKIFVGIFKSLGIFNLIKKEFKDFGIIFIKSLRILEYFFIIFVRIFLVKIFEVCF